MYDAPPSTTHSSSPEQRVDGQVPEDCAQRVVVITFIHPSCAYISTTKKKGTKESNQSLLFPRETQVFLQGEALSHVSYTCKTSSNSIRFFPPHPAVKDVVVLRRRVAPCVSRTVRVRCGCGGRYQRCTFISEPRGVNILSVNSFKVRHIFFCDSVRVLFGIRRVYASDRNFTKNTVDYDTPPSWVVFLIVDITH